MSGDGGTPAGDRLPRRNQARQAEYAGRLARWARIDGQLAQAERTAREWFGPARPRPGGPPLELGAGERVLAVIPALTLVEVRRVPGRRHPGYTGYAARTAAELCDRRPATPAERQLVLAHGPVTVTDLRAVFHLPARNVEWPFADLVRIEHAAGRPVSLLHVTGREKVSGLLYRCRDAGHVRLTLELAAGHHAGDRDGVLARLAAERQQHALDWPAPPGGTRPGDPPGHRRLARVAGAAYLDQPPQSAW